MGVIMGRCVKLNRSLHWASLSSRTGSTKANTPYSSSSSLIAVKREQLDLGFLALPFLSVMVMAPMLPAGCMADDRAIKRPATHNQPEPATSPVVVLRDDRHRGALRPTTSGLSEEDVLREHREAHLVQVISRALPVCKRPIAQDGRLHVAENERREARLARIGKKPRCVVDLAFGRVGGFLLYSSS